MRKRTCQDKKCDGTFYHWTSENVKFCPYCGKKLGKIQEPEPMIPREIHNCEVVDGNLVDSEGKRVPVELFNHFSLTRIDEKA